MAIVDKQETLPLRARLGLYVLMFMLKVISPVQWEHDIKDVTEKIMKELENI